MSTPQNAEKVTLTEGEAEALGPFIWGAWIGVAEGREADYSRELRATVESIIAARISEAEKGMESALRRSGVSLCATDGLTAAEWAVKSFRDLLYSPGQRT